MTRSAFPVYGICPADLDYSTLLKQLFLTAAIKSFQQIFRVYRGRIRTGKELEGEKKAGSLRSDILHDRSNYNTVKLRQKSIFNFRLQCI